jgi:hypothetical protein
MNGLSAALQDRRALVVRVDLRRFDLILCRGVEIRRIRVVGGGRG